MSTNTEALAAEVKPNLPAQLAVKAADALLSQDHRVYTKIPTEVTHGGGANNNKKRTNSHKDNKSGGEPKAKDETAAGASKKSSKNKNSRNRNRRSTSGENEIASLRAEVTELHEENLSIRKELDDLRKLVQNLGVSTSSAATCQGATTEKNAPAGKKEEAGGNNDDDFDLFGSEEEEDDAEKQRITEERLKAYAAKKAKKPGPIAKSSVILEVKPWDDETDLDEMERLVKSIEMDGLLWGACKRVPIGYGISKLQIVCTVEDEKVSVDDLQEKISENEDHVQSVDIIAFNKI